MNFPFTRSISIPEDCNKEMAAEIDIYYEEEPEEMERRLTVRLNGVQLWPLRTNLKAISSG